MKTAIGIIFVLIFLLVISGTQKVNDPANVEAAQKNDQSTITVREHAVSGGPLDYSKQKLVALSRPRPSPPGTTLPGVDNWSPEKKVEGELVSLSYKWEGTAPSDARQKKLVIILRSGGITSFLHNYDGLGDRGRRVAPNEYRMGKSEIRFWAGFSDYMLWGSGKTRPASKGTGYCLWIIDGEDYDRKNYDMAVSNVLRFIVFGPIKFDGDW